MPEQPSSAFMEPGGLLRDALTGVYSRAALQERFPEEVQRAIRYNESLSLCVLDLDYFKSINDAFGHSRGDEVISEVVERIQSRIRGADLLFRYGGDEFVLLLPNTRKEQALRTAGRILDAVRIDPFPGAPPLSLSVSIGLASLPDDANEADALFQKADYRNYVAKRQGRCQIVNDDPAASALVPFQEATRLVERDEQLQQLQEFLRALGKGQRGLFLVSGPVGSGQTRFLDEASRAARLQRFIVVQLEGTPAFKTRPYGALIRAFPPEANLIEWTQPEAMARAVADYLATREEASLIVTVDGFANLDPATVNLLHFLLYHSTLPGMGLIYAAEERAPHPLFHTPVAVHGLVELKPFSRNGVHIWIRNLLQWEPPQAFIDWLTYETGGLPAALEQGVQYLIDHDVLVRQNPSGWEFGQDYLSVALAERIGGQRTLPPNNLPVIPSSFVGRGAERRQLGQLLQQRELVTLLGPGGIGKTRLALQVARDLLPQFDGGVYFVPLATIREPDLVATAVAQALGVKEVAGESLEDSLSAYLRDSAPVLLVLDNFEQVTAGAPTVAKLLSVSPRTRILVTSREVLQLYGEHQFNLDALTVPDPAALRAGAGTLVSTLSPYTAIALFVERAQAVNPDFVLTEENGPAIAAICHRLDGLPLAIELAAARSKLLSPQAMLARLGSGKDAPSLHFLTSGPRNLPPRQQTLRGAVDWSYELLQPEEQALFTRLSVFVGGCTLDSAETICDPSDGQVLDILNGLGSLVDQSLIRGGSDMGSDEARFIMLETIREYATEQLKARGEQELMRERHMSYFLQMANQAESAMRSAEQSAWLARLEEEHDNLRAAIQYALQSHRVEPAARLAASLVRFWWARGHMTEGRRWLDTILTESNREDVALPPDLRARVLSGSGTLALELGDHVRGSSLLEESLALSRQAENREGVAACLNRLGVLAYYQGEFERALMLLDESLSIRRAMGDRSGISDVLNNLGQVHHHLGNFDQAELLFEQSLAEDRVLGDKRGAAVSIHNLGCVAYERGELERATKLFEEGMSLFREVGDKGGDAETMNYLGMVAFYQGNVDMALSLLHESVALSRSIGEQWVVAAGLTNLGRVVAQHGRQDDARTYLSEGLTLHLRLANRPGLARTLLALAILACIEGNALLAARLFGSAAAVREQLRAPLSPIQYEEYERYTNMTRTLISGSAWQEAWQEGEAMELKALNPEVLDTGVF